MTPLQGFFALLTLAATCAATAAPLKGTLLCSACEIMARELAVENAKMHRTNPKALSELQLIEVTEKACTATLKYKIAQENSGGHFKVFADENSAVDRLTIEVPQFFGDETNYQGATGRAYHMCEEYVGNYEEEITLLLNRRSAEAQIRDRLCLRTTKVCDADFLKPYKTLEKEKRKVWRRMKRRDAAAKGMEATYAEELDDDEIEDAKELVKMGLGTDEKKKSWHVNTDREKEANEKLARKERKVREERDRVEKRKKLLADARAEWEADQKTKESIGTGKSFEEWKKEYDAARNVDWGDEGKLDEDDEDTKDL